MRTPLARAGLRRHPALASALGAALALSVAAPGVAEAQTPSDARTHHEAGVALFEEGRYEEAVVEFERAHALSGRDHLLLNVARALELAGHPGRAADALDEYLAAEPDAEDAATLRARVRRLRRRAESEAPSAPEAEPVGHAADSPPPSPVEPAADDGWIGPAVLLTLAGAALVAGAVTGAVALDLHGSVSERCDADDRCPPDTRGDIDTGVALTLGSDLLFGTAAALAAAGVVWWLVEELGHAPDAPSTRVDAACTPAACGAWLRASFH